MLTIHLRINDAATGQPSAARIRVSGPEGAQYAPLGRFVDFPLRRNEAVGGQVAIGAERWFYINGACEIALPAGVPLRVQATKGPEYTPLDQTVTLGAGQMALRFALARAADLRAEGWVSVDTRCHFLSPHDALLEAAAEDVDVVNLLATVQPFASMDGTVYSTAPNLLAFSGQHPALEHNGRAVIINTLNTHPVLGRVALLHSHRPVFPLAFGGEETDDWSICDWCDQCHRKGGLVVWVDAFEPAGGIVGGEALAAAILGKIDAIELSALPRKTPLLPWLYRLWDARFRIPIVGASGKDSNRVPLGQMRTCARLDGANWIEAIRAGRTVVTDGPLLNWQRWDNRVHAVLRGHSSSRVEIVANGRVVAAGEGSVEATIDDGSWVAMRCQSAAGGLAHSSPIMMGTPRRRPEAVTALLKLVDETRAWIESTGRFVNPKRKSALIAHCDAARAELEQPT